MSFKKSNNVLELNDCGEIKKLMKLLLKKFPNKNFEWVKECSKIQLEKIDDYIFLNISYNDFYKLIHS